jgi:hypothetical protein
MLGFVHGGVGLLDEVFDTFAAVGGDVAEAETEGIDAVRLSLMLVRRRPGCAR